MKQTRIELNNGQILASGQSGDAIVSLGLTRAVNSGQELTLGSVCAAMAELELLVQGTSPIGQGDSFVLFRGEEKIGVFTAEKPVWKSAHRVKITAYDNVVKLDKDLTAWLESWDNWPCTLQELAHAVCEACGVELLDQDLPNGDFLMESIPRQTVTGRKLMGWIGQATGRFCHAQPDGTLVFGWYIPVEQSIGPAGLPEDDRIFYYQGSLSLADYQTAPIEKVQIRQDDRDVGTLWPDMGEGNTYCITGNPLLAARTAEDLLPVAQNLYLQLQNVSYTPCTVTISGDENVFPGQILQVTDAGGRVATVYVMETNLNGSKMTVKSVGSASRDSITLKNSQTEVLNGKLLRLQTDVEGLRAEHVDTAGKTASLSVTVEGIESKVTAQQTELDSTKENLTALRQDTDSLELEIKTITEQGVERVVTKTGYSFSDEGLRISKSGLEMENLLDHTGMYVSRNGQTILQANNRGVEARDVTVQNFLVVGSHARFEDYGNGTACFYI